MVGRAYSLKIYGQRLQEAILQMQTKKAHRDLNANAERSSPKAPVGTHHATRNASELWLR